MIPKTSLPVRTRRVHYIEGFDPRGASFYHRLYSEEAFKQARLSGTSMEIGTLRTINDHLSQWDVTGVWDSEQVKIEYQFMGWDDLMRKQWMALVGPRSLLLYLKYLLLGDAYRVARVSGKFFCSTITPIFCLFFVGLLILLSAFLGGVAVIMLTGLWLPAAAVAGFIAFGVGYKGFRTAKKAGTIWLLRVCTFVVNWGEGPQCELDERINGMANHILKAQQLKPVDEVLIIGHSIGAMLSVSVAARMLEKESFEFEMNSMHLMTLGECIPFLGLLPGAGVFRRDLEILTGDRRIPWTDFTALKDMLCFFKANPSEACGLPPGAEDRPRRIVVPIHRMFPRKKYSKILRDQLRLHLQYLMASELQVDYDYFFITAGPRLLREHRKNLRSVRVTPT